MVEDWVHITNTKRVLVYMKYIYKFQMKKIKVRRGYKDECVLYQGVVAGWNGFPGLDNKKPEGKNYLNWISVSRDNAHVAIGPTYYFFLICPFFYYFFFQIFNRSFYYILKNSYFSNKLSLKQAKITAKIYILFNCEHQKLICFLFFF